MCNAWNHPSYCNCGWGGDNGNQISGFAVNPHHRSGKRKQSALSFFDGSYFHVEKRYFGEGTIPNVCVYCGENVYFIRHNGGCVWLEPPLGPPWEKHSCYYNDLRNQETFSSFSAFIIRFNSAYESHNNRRNRYNFYGEPHLVYIRTILHTSLWGIVMVISTNSGHTAVVKQRSHRKTIPSSNLIWLTATGVNEARIVGSRTKISPLSLDPITDLKYLKLKSGYYYEYLGGKLESITLDELSIKAGCLIE